MGKDAFYFCHDTNARNDPKLITIRRKYGWEGYGSYFGIIEFLREQDEYKVSVDRIEDCLYELRIKQDIFNDLVNVGLLVVNETGFFSESLLRRMERYDNIREKRRIAASSGGRSTGKKLKTQLAGLVEKPDSELDSVNREANGKANGEANTKADTKADTKLKRREEREERDKIKENKKEHAAQVEIPEHLLKDPIFVKTWHDWLLHLKQKKSKPTQSALEKQLKLCESMATDDAVRMIEKSILSNWQGLFPPDNAKSRAPEAFDAFKSIDNLFGNQEKNQTEKH